MIKKYLKAPFSFFFFSKGYSEIARCRFSCTELKDAWRNGYGDFDNSISRHKATLQNQFIIQSEACLKRLYKIIVDVPLWPHEPSDLVRTQLTRKSTESD